MTSPTTQAQAREAVELPELPEPVNIALFEGHCMQGPEIRGLSGSYEPGCAQYTADQMRAYALSVSAAKQEELDKMREAGAQLANCAFNLSQAAGRVLSERDAKTLKVAQTQWDAALSPSQGNPK